MPSGWSVVTIADRLLATDPPASNETSSTQRYSYSAAGDTADLILDATNQLVERIHSLPGGVTVTDRPAAGTPDVWAYPNVHGDVIITTTGDGIRTGRLTAYDPFGQTIDPVTGLIGTTTADDAGPDTLSGSLDNGWLGQHARPYEHAGTIATVEMGARAYVSGLGHSGGAGAGAGAMSPWGDDYAGQASDAGTSGDAGVEDRDVQDSDHDRPADAAQAGTVAVAADQPPLYYGSVDEFVRLYLRLVYRRRIDGTHRRWAARWWEHEEAIIRLEALWRAWEHLRLDPATGMSVWWRDHADHHMRVLMDPDGPFADIDVDETGQNTSRRGDPLPYEAPPPGLFPDERA